jgi:hypothetical protein
VETAARGDRTAVYRASARLSPSSAISDGNFLLRLGEAGGTIVGNVTREKNTTEAWRWCIPRRTGLSTYIHPSRDYETEVLHANTCAVQKLGRRVHFPRRELLRRPAEREKTR